MTIDEIHDEDAPEELTADEIVSRVIDGDPTVDDIITQATGR